MDARTEKATRLLEFVDSHLPQHPDRCIALKNHGGRTPGGRKAPERRQQTYGFGNIEFKTSASRPQAPFVRITVDKTRPAGPPELAQRVLQLMLDGEFGWGMELPSLIISVTGGAQNFSMNRRLLEVFSEGLADAARASQAWVITGGTNSGVMKYVGDAFRSFEDSSIPVIGITPWSVVMHRVEKLQFPRHGRSSEMQPEQLVRRYLSEEEGTHKAVYQQLYDNDGKHVALDPNHTHFVLVDNGTDGEFGGEIAFRAAFELACSNCRRSNPYIDESDRNPEAPPTPIVLVVVQGGQGTLDNVTESFLAGTPVVVVEDSGGVADSLATAWHHFHFSGSKTVLAAQIAGRCQPFAEFLTSFLQDDFTKQHSHVLQAVVPDVYRQADEFSRRPQFDAQDQETFLDNLATCLDTFKTYVRLISDKRITEDQSMFDCFDACPVARDHVLTWQGDLTKAKNTLERVKKSLNKVAEGDFENVGDMVTAVLGDILDPLLSLAPLVLDWHKRKRFLQAFPGGSGGHEGECCDRLRKSLPPTGLKWPVEKSVRHLTCVAWNKERMATYSLAATHESFDSTLLRAFLHGAGKPLSEQLRFCVEWKRLDLARNEVLNRMSGSKGKQWAISPSQLKDCLHLAFTKELPPPLIWLLLEYARVDAVDIQRLYNDCKCPLTLNSVLRKSTSTSVLISYDVINTLFSDAFAPHYKSTYSANSKTCRTDLALFAVLFGRYELAKFLWSKTRRPLRAGLCVLRMAKYVRQYGLWESQSELENCIDWFESTLVDLVSYCNQKDEKITRKLICQPFDPQSFGDSFSVLDMAFLAEFGRLMRLRCITRTMAAKWRGYLSTTVKTRHVLAGVLFPPLVFWSRILPFDSSFPSGPASRRRSELVPHVAADGRFVEVLVLLRDSRGTPVVHEAPSDLTVTASSLPHAVTAFHRVRRRQEAVTYRAVRLAEDLRGEKLEVTAMLRGRHLGNSPLALHLSYLNKLCPTEQHAQALKDENASDESNCRPEDVLLQSRSALPLQYKTARGWTFAQFYWFHQAPVVKFWTRFVCYAFFLLAYSVMTVSRLDADSVALEVVVVFWFAMIVLDEAHQVWDNGPEVWWRSGWNRLDFFMIVVCVLGISFRWSDVTVAKLFYALGAICFYVRLLNVFSVNKSLGPLLVMIQKMFKDIFLILGILGIMVVGFGIAFQATLFPDSDNVESQDVFTIVFFRPVFSIFGETFVDEIWTGQENCQNTAMCGRPTIIAPILLVVYLVVTVVLLLNLLIAMMSDTYSNVRDNSTVVWLFQRFELIKEYEEAAVFPPPLNFLSLLYNVVVFFMSRNRSLPESVPLNPTSPPNDSEPYGPSKLVQECRDSLLRDRWKDRRSTLDAKVSQNSEQLTIIRQALQEDRDLLQLAAKNASVPPNTQSSPPAAADAAAAAAAAESTSLSHRVRRLESAMKQVSAQLAAISGMLAGDVEKKA